jgi:LacI family transcriptional regulator
VKTIAVNTAGISYEATRYLLDSGHRRIAFISTLKSDSPFSTGTQVDSSQISERLDGMRQAFSEAGLTFPIDLVRLNAGDADSIRKITRELLFLPDPATVVVASDGLIALSVLGAIQELELSIPADVSFLMYDDFAWTRLTTPPLTVIAQPVYDMGVAAATALIQQVEGRKVSNATPTLEARLIKRGSVGSPSKRSSSSGNEG